MPFATPSTPWGGLAAHARTVGRAATTSAASTPATANHKQAVQSRAFGRRNFRQAKAEPSSAVTQMTKPLATGKATRWQG